ncbi:MAG: hypothetical protein A2639_02605 [Candidatus Staskawiczbacteria bacterium RIFCSPHIGHO2_01_FULL_34_27]|uniref:Uncharacterized protein n=1 Tax=Candidatus Staskawiczbacteria bacterium RIFCSPHIGHO2_01_FULL_34_27 TaxID=1802199 RepID=A0A1G2HJL1_9BACT|nr:MAG: hypothetical protein A2639_02605 [Candidatus Staskawiczbacteria bacterium RIFCSPHIGHO2_01_FULL_34_27]
MERTTKLETAQKIMGKNFIGPEELVKISQFLKIAIPKGFPNVPFEKSFLKKIKKDYILILGISKDKNGKALTINRMREIFGTDPKKSEPCFYNQDWYLKEKFADKETLDFNWYLISKKVEDKTRSKDPNTIIKNLNNKQSLPSAVLSAFTFFTYYLLKRGILWEKDFIWCKDQDANGDRIYVGRYKDVKKINKNGFNIHRHLSIRHYYGFAPEYCPEFKS